MGPLARHPVLGSLSTAVQCRRARCNWRASAYEKGTNGRMRLLQPPQHGNSQNVVACTDAVGAQFEDTTRTSMAVVDRVALCVYARGAWVLCGEGEDVVGVHTLHSGLVQVCHELLVGEEEEKEKEQGRQEEREVERGGQSEENSRSRMTMWMSVKSDTQT